MFTSIRESLVFNSGDKNEQYCKSFHTLSAFDKHALVFTLTSSQIYVKFLYLVFHLNVQPTLNSLGILHF